MSEEQQVVYCAAPDCGKVTDSELKCPICLKNGFEQVFCNQICYKSAYSKHKAVHPQEDSTEPYNPFPTFKFPGKLTPQYPLSPKRYIPPHIVRPDHADDGIPKAEQKADRLNNIPILTKEEIKRVRKACMVGREVLDIVASHVKPGITTDELDRICHEETIKRNAYPSPLNYYNFPKSICTSVNEIICHGIPDQRPLEEGDIVNLDVTVYIDGMHADLNETYYVGEKISRDSINTTETARECLKLAIKHCKPGVPFRELGDIIEKHATENKCSVVRAYVGHGVGKLFHCAPNIPHYAKNKTPGIMKPGMVFTIEPMINAGVWKDVSWPDDWTSSTVDGKVSAQFEHTLLITENGVEILTARNKKSPGGPRERISKKAAEAGEA